MRLLELRRQVLEFARRMVADGLARGSQGNISVRDPASGLIAITPSAAAYTTLAPEDVVLLDAEGLVVDGRRQPTSELALHLAIYRRRIDVGAVVHSHAPFASAFAVLSRPIPPVLAEAAACVGGEVPVTPYRTPGTEALGQAALEALGDGLAVLLAQHGLVTVGPDLSRAYAVTIAVEDAARLILYARILGGEPSALPPAEVEKLHRLWLERYHPQALAEEE